MNESDFRKKLLGFLHKSPTPFHVVSYIAETLQQQDFAELKEAEKAAQVA